MKITKKKKHLEKFKTWTLGISILEPRWYWRCFVIEKQIFSTVFRWWYSFLFHLSFTITIVSFFFFFYAQHVRLYIFKCALDIRFVRITLWVNTDTWFVDVPILDLLPISFNDNSIEQRFRTDLALLSLFYCNKTRTLRLWFPLLPHEQ